MVRWGYLSPHRSVETLGTITEELSNKWVSMSRSRVANEINSTFLQAGIDFDLLLGEGGGSVMDVMQFHRNQFSDVSQCVSPSQPIFQA